MHHFNKLAQISFVTIISASLAATGCLVSGTCPEIKWGYMCGEFNYYKNIAPAEQTAQGIRVDDSDLDIDYSKLDRMTAEVESCLGQSIDRSSFVVKIADNWVPSCDGSEQLLPVPVLAGGEGCLAKNLNPTDKCPCRWRAGIKAPNTLIVTPNMKLYKDVLVRFVTNNPNTWVLPELTKCVTPDTE